jgi:hypothetical protein
VKQFCADVPVGGGRAQECLRRNEARLSPACKAKRTAVEAGARKIVEEFGTACHRDIDRLCSETKPGGGRILACLARQLDDLSSTCRAQTERIQEAAEKISTVRAACAADAGRLCADVPPSAGPLVECLQANRASLSEKCRSLGGDTALVPAELVDAVNSLKGEERSQ